MQRKFVMEGSKTVSIPYTTDWFVIYLSNLPEYKLSYGEYVIIDVNRQEVRVTYCYRLWQKKLAELFTEDLNRSDIVAFRVNRGFSRKSKTALYIQ